MNKTQPIVEPVSVPSGRANLFATLLIVLAVGLGSASILGWLDEPRRLVFSYLTALMFVTSVSLGALAWLLIMHLTGAIWSTTLRRLLENLTTPLPWIALLFIAVALNLSRLYEWADTARVAANAELARKAVWLNPTAFNIRMAFCLGTWAFIAALLSRSSVRQDRTSDPSLVRRMGAISTWGTVAVALTASLAAFDWLMSLDAHWSSTIFAVYFWAGALVSALAALILFVLTLHSFGYLRQSITTEHLHDLGKLLFGFVIFWAYIAFSQYFLIWYANFPEETRWYVIRRTGDWNTLSWALVFGHFAVPFFLLLPRATKRNPFWLGFVSMWILAFHYADLYWLIMPAYHVEQPDPRWLDVSLPLTLVCCCGAIIARACQARPLIPIGDPRLTESIAFRNS